MLFVPFPLLELCKKTITIIIKEQYTLFSWLISFKSYFLLQVTYNFLNFSFELLFFNSKASYIDFICDFKGDIRFHW